MSQERHEVILAGVGGMGIQVASMVLGQAASTVYKYVTLCPLYATSLRFGSSECTVMMSPEPIASPLKQKVNELVVIESSQLELFIGRLKPGGLVITERAGLAQKPATDNLTILDFPGVEIALALGSRRVSNFVLLGTYIGVTRAVPPEAVECELERRFSTAPKMLSLNRNAFLEGLKMAVGWELRSKQRR